MWVTTSNAVRIGDPLVATSSSPSATIRGPQITVEGTSESNNVVMSVGTHGTYVNPALSAMLMAQDMLEYYTSDADEAFMRIAGREAAAANRLVAEEGTA